ncbi:MAG TPA: hypothetical protein VGC42_02915 [Kofleriaceae bacterium]
MDSHDTALSDAAAAFDEELATYSRLGDLFLKQPMASVKQLERSNAVLGEIAKSEERLQAAGQRMVQALSAARGRQEQLAALVVAHVPAIQDRNQQLNGLMAELTSVAGEVGSLNTLIAGVRPNGDATRPPIADDARDISSRVLALSERAEQLANQARSVDFAELADQAHALHQRLQAVGKKLQKAGDE